MRLLHTADWHLGKSLKNADLSQNQRYALEQLLDVVEKEKPDVVLLAGDIYDRALPPAHAVEIFNWAMSEIVLRLRTPVIAIAGNHDSPERIDYLSGMLHQQGLYIFGKPNIYRPVVLQDRYGEVHFHPLPFAEPANCNHFAGQAAFSSHEEVLATWVKNIKMQMDPKARHVAIGHVFITNGKTSESERPLHTVGGASEVPAEIFSPFHYTAQGHLHRPQSFLAGSLRYSGSLLKYSFSEADHQKCFLIVEIDQYGKVTSEKISILHKQEVLSVEGYIREGVFQLQLRQNQNPPGKEDFLEVTLLNLEPVINAAEIIQRQYPFTLSIRQSCFIRQHEEQYTSAEEISLLSDVEIITKFFQRYLPEINAMQEKVIKELVEQIKQAL
ncbi:MAG: exonuclease SbcCD subunit D [Cytophagales bacterium]|nr:exonuclease SbcCD subunit D [Bernardetiaceae bacterium]MDW8209802.1 exonuclease SbcCD subunit D [Cytophagales bacterium]